MEEKSMYKFLRKLLPVFEQIFNIREVTMSDNDPYFGNRIKIKGVDDDNRSFELLLTVEDSKTGAEE